MEGNMKKSIIVVGCGLIVALMNIIFFNPKSNGFLLGIIIIFIGYVLKEIEDLKDNK